MSQSNKKNDWWRIERASASYEVKAEYVFNVLKQKFPTIVVNGAYDAHLTIKGFKVYFRIKTAQSSEFPRIRLRYSTETDDLRRKTTRSCSNDVCGEVKETHRYSDGSTRIDLDSVFSSVDAIISRLSAKADDINKAKFKAQLDQMKITGRINTCLNSDLYIAKAVPSHTQHIQIYRVGASENLNDYICFVMILSPTELNIRFTNSASFSFSVENLEDSIKDFEHVFKYLK